MHRLFLKDVINARWGLVSDPARRNRRDADWNAVAVNCSSLGLDVHNKQHRS